MNGKSLKFRLQTIEPNLSEAAKKLNMSRQSLQQALEAADIKTGLVEKIASTYNMPVSFFFDDTNEKKSIVQNGDGIFQNAGRDTNIGNIGPEHLELAELRVEAKMYREQLEAANRIIDDLREMNKFLMSK